MSTVNKWAADPNAVLPESSPMANFQKFHRKEYPVIDPTSAPNSQAGKTVMIIGGSYGIGRVIAKSFIAASASRVIIASRNAEGLAKAVGILETSVPGSKTTIISRQVDLGDVSTIDALFDGLKSDGIEVDVLVLDATINGAASISKNWKETWRWYEINLRGNMVAAERFMAQGPEKGKFLINITTTGAHFNPCPGYELYSITKASFATLIQHLADETPVDQCQIISLHPGRVLTEKGIEQGYTPDIMPFDSENLPANWCVWGATPQAAFLHGRFVWSHWDVDELRGMQEELSNPGFLKFGLQGFPMTSPLAYINRTE